MDEENKRIEINDLPRTEEELTDDEEKGVTGGGGTSVGGMLVSLGDGSVRQASDSTLSANKVTTVGGSRTEDV